MKNILLSKRTYIVTIIAVFLFGNVVSFAASPILKEIKAYLDSSIRMTIHGKEFVARDAKGNPIVPISYNGSTYLPTRAISEAVGLDVQWDENTRTVKLGNFITDEAGKSRVVVKSPDNTYQLTFGEGWVKENRLTLSNPAIDLGISTASEYTAVIIESAEDFSGDIFDYTDTIISLMGEDMDDYSVESQTEIVVNDYDALQTKINASIQKLQVTYLITVLKAEDTFYQVLSWTTRSKFEESYKEFVEIANSFKTLQ